MKKITFVTAIIMFSCMIFDVVTDNITSKDVNPNTVSTNSYTYIIKEYNGKLAVFESVQEKPYKVTNLSLTILPEYDKQLLQKGIEVSSVKELNKILEDYLS